MTHSCPTRRSSELGSDAQRKEHVVAVRKRAEGAPVHVEVHALFEAPGLLPGLAKAEGQYADIALIPGAGGWQSDGLRRHITEALKIGRATCRESRRQYVTIPEAD